MKRQDIGELLPQRAPLLMVDELLEVNGNEALTSFVIRPGNFLGDEDGRLAASGLVEHIAQSASAYAGYMAKVRGGTAPPVGYIAEVKDFACHYRPQTGETLHTRVRFEAEAEGVTLLHGETRAGEKAVAETRMKIFIRPDKVEA